MRIHWVSTVLVWVQVCFVCWSADKLQPVAVDQQLQTTAKSGLASDEDRSRSRMHGAGGIDLIRSEATAGCFDVVSESSTLLQDDLARITLNTDIQACRNSGESFVTASGTSQLTMSIERTARKIVSLAKSSTDPMTGTVTLYRVGQQRPLWQAELDENAQKITSAFAIELSVGEYVVELNTEQTSSRTGTSDVRVSIVNRGDINGNEEFDNADLEVLDAILGQSTYVVPADLDDDGDNDRFDRRLWVDGLRPDVNRTSQSLEVVPVAEVVFDEQLIMPDEELVVPELPEQDPAEPEIRPPVTSDIAPEPMPDEPMPDEPLGNEIVPPTFSPRPVGDINGDGSVGFEDFLEFSVSFGASAEVNESADLNQDGVIGFADFLTFSRHYPGQRSSSVVSTPEPKGTVLAAFCVFALAASQRRTNRRDFDHSRAPSCG